MITIIIIQSILLWWLMGFYSTVKVNPNQVIWFGYVFAPIIFIYVIGYIIYKKGIKKAFNIKEEYNE